MVPTLIFGLSSEKLELDELEATDDSYLVLFGVDWAIAILIKWPYKDGIFLTLGLLLWFGIASMISSRLATWCVDCPRLFVTELFLLLIFPDFDFLDI